MIIFIALCLFLSFILALSGYSARAMQAWRNADACIAAVCVVLTVVAGIVEAWCVVTVANQQTNTT